MKHNFFPGPNIIESSVLEAVFARVQSSEQSISVLEKSHREPDMAAVIAEATSLTKELLGLNDEFEVLFLHGGSRLQFLQIPYNLSQVFKTAYFVETGIWATQARREASFFCDAKILASSEEDGFCSLPTSAGLPEDICYLHMVSNNTVYGTQFKEFPTIEQPLVVDVTSDLFTRTIDYNQFDLFFASTQKNIGTAGACMVCLKPSILKKDQASIPMMMDYRTHIEKKSLYNTPPVFALVTLLETLKWIKKSGGVAYFEEQSQKKASLIYDEIDRNELFLPYANKENRSLINATFTGINKEIEREFLDFAKQNDIEGIKGYRTVGGFRASMYNALSLDSVRVLVNVMQEFERQKG